MNNLHPKDALPTFDKDSEQAQVLKDKAEKIYHESLKPHNIEPQTIRDTVEWAYRNGKLGEIAQNIDHDEFYVGSLLTGLVRDYLKVKAWEEAEREDRNED